MFQKIMYLLTSLFYKIRRPIVQMDPASYSGLVSEMKKEFVTKGEFRQEMDRIDKKFDAIDQRFDTMEKKLDVVSEVEAEAVKEPASERVAARR